MANKARYVISETIGFDLKPVWELKERRFYTAGGRCRYNWKTIYRGSYTACEQKLTALTTKSFKLTTPT